MTGRSTPYTSRCPCNSIFGNGGGIDPPDQNKYFQLGKADIMAINVEARHLHIDFWIIKDAANEFPSDSWEQHKALTVANKIIDTFELGNQDSIVEARKIAQEFLGKNVNSADVYKTGKQPNCLRHWSLPHRYVLALAVRGDQAKGR